MNAQSTLGGELEKLQAETFEILDYASLTEEMNAGGCSCSSTSTSSTTSSTSSSG